MFKRFFSSAEDAPKKRPELNIQFASLMWPGDPPPPSIDKPQKWQADLGLSDLARAMAGGGRYQTFVHRILAELTIDTDVITWRQAVLDDFAQNPALVDDIEALLPRLANLSQNSTLLGRRKRSLLLQTGERLAELEIYVDAVLGLHEALKSVTLSAPAMMTLRDNLSHVLDDEDFQAMRRQLPQLRGPMEGIASLTVGINLDSQLRPESAVLLAVNTIKLGGSTSLLERVIGPASNESDASGVVPLNYLPKEPELRPYDPFYQDLEKLMNHVAKPVAEALARYTRISSQPLTHLEYELAFYVSAVRLRQRLADQGIPVCFPESLPQAERRAEIRTLYNINLCLKQSADLVPSDAEFGERGRIAVLTGPNSGGKTTYIQAVGLAQAMYQAGLFICAEHARISPVDAILTHFPALETRQQGRLAEEAERLRSLFQHVTRHSLVLLNETFSSTSAGEAVFLAQDVLGGLRAIGVRAIYATHLVELVDHIAEIDARLPGDSSLFTLVAGIRLDENGEPVRTFQIARGKPLGRSYAQEIARRHGISLEQILEAQRAAKTDSSEEATE